MRQYNIGVGMETTRRIKKLNGIEYWFEETPYYELE